jgi:hypothetical protein
VCPVWNRWQVPETVFDAIGLIVLTLAGSQISEMARFDTSALPAFGLPRKLPP